MKHTDPLNAIGQFFEMPTKEAFLDKVKPTMSFIGYYSNLNLIGLVVLVGLGLFAYLALRGRR